MRLLIRHSPYVVARSVQNPTSAKQNEWFVLIAIQVQKRYHFKREREKKLKLFSHVQLWASNHIDRTNIDTKQLHQFESKWQSLIQYEKKKAFMFYYFFLFYLFLEVSSSIPFKTCKNVEWNRMQFIHKFYEYLYK